MAARDGKAEIRTGFLRDLSGCPCIAGAAARKFLAGSQIGSHVAGDPAALPRDVYFSVHEKIIVHLTVGGCELSAPANS